jgi:hypothetical protein
MGSGLGGQGRHGGQHGPVEAPIRSDSPAWLDLSFLRVEKGPVYRPGALQSSALSPLHPCLTQSPPQPLLPCPSIKFILCLVQIGVHQWQKLSPFSFPFVLLSVKIFVSCTNFIPFPIKDVGGRTIVRMPSYPSKSCSILSSCQKNYWLRLCRAKSSVPFVVKSLQ